ncbi:putative Dna polymerase epsilon subunit 3 [Cardiosporidium cionae]|uniref:Dna polymerase epsilon subunit 3 n=1 Tax=Cardiosporidium cionae TaxID=476202 RepID=A0ABQ7JEW9_9APIC|nr:putative Dna polymerase epsilon subunit 3 [Cardiosporidium cionae]|eukprot:KAF8822557.1 putative Dna polymerase epsilon subunit 3 [Cardiosporidium cionae]
MDHPVIGSDVSDDMAAVNAGLPSLPTAHIMRITKSAVGKDTRVSKSALLGLNRCAGLFSLYLLSAANEVTQSHKNRSTVTADDVIQGLSNIHFENLSEQLISSKNASKHEIAASGVLPSDKSIDRIETDLSVEDDGDSPSMMELSSSTMMKHSSDIDENAHNDFSATEDDAAMDLQVEDIPMNYADSLEALLETINASDNEDFSELDNSLDT